MEKHFSICFKTENIFCFELFVVFCFLYDLKFVNLGIYTYRLKVLSRPLKIER